MTNLAHSVIQPTGPWLIRVPIFFLVHGRYFTLGQSRALPCPENISQSLDLGKEQLVRQAWSPLIQLFFGFASDI